MIRKRAIIIIGVVAAAAIVALFISFSSSPLPPDGSHDSWNQNSSIPCSFGDDPIVLEDNGTGSYGEMYLRLQNVTDDAEQDLERYYYPNGPVLGHGYDKKGMVVLIYEDREVNETVLQDVYSVIERHGEQNGIKRIFTRFLPIGLMKLDSSPNQSSPGSYKLDAWCEIQEFNMTIVHDGKRTAVHVTDEDLEPYPEFGIYLHDVNDDPTAWHFGTRLVTDIDCNGSRALQFLTLYRKYEETPFQPVLEYNGRYYSMGVDYRDAHSTARPTPSVPASTQTTSPIATGTISTQDPGSRCNITAADSRIPVPANISVAIRDSMSGIRYSLNESESGRTIVLGKGDIIELNLRWIPGLGFHWVIPVSGCGIELVNAGTYSDGGDFWNVTGHYRVRYWAVSPGTSVIDGKFILVHDEEGVPGFNLTVIVE